MNILILGGNGYIGSKVVREFVNVGDTVVCTKRSTSNLLYLEDINDKIKWIPASIDGVESAMQYTQFDYVLNMACNYGRSNILYGDVLDANIEFPLKVLNIAVEHRTKKFLTIGTSLPGELNMYSFSKKMFSEFGKFYVDKHGITFNVLLLEMFYGADEPVDRFLPSVIIKMIREEPVETTIGTQRRDIISSADVVMAIMMVVRSNLEGFREIPIGTGEAPTISEIVDYIWMKTGRRSVVKKGAIPMRNNEPDCVADVSKISAIGEWNPIGWKDGLNNMIEKLSENLRGGGKKRYSILKVYCRLFTPIRRYAA